jgi:hypothetical protein
MEGNLPFHTYSPEGGEPRLVQSGVLFLDVMGVEQGACDPDRLDFLRRLRSALEEARSVAGVDDDGILHASSLFSDSLIVAFPLLGGLVPEDVIHAAEVMAARVQLELISHGFFLRGGLAFGEHYMDRNFAFGPALVEAAVLEKRAIVPRVVLSAGAAAAERAALEEFGEDDDAAQRQYLITDAEDITFISYLDVVIDVDDEDEARGWLESHRQVICEKLNEHAGQPKIESKYLWAARYHNHVCIDRAPQPMGSQHVIDLGEMPCGLEGFGWDLS